MANAYYAMAHARKLVKAWQLYMIATLTALKTVL